MYEKWCFRRTCWTNGFYIDFLAYWDEVAILKVDVGHRMSASRRMGMGQAMGLEEPQSLDVTECAILRLALFCTHFHSNLYLQAHSHQHASKIKTQSSINT